MLRRFTGAMRRVSFDASRRGLATAGGPADPFAYCRDVVRQHDYEAFLISRLYPAGAQPAYFALKAFYIELANVRDTVSNTTLGKMRFQFWRDAVKGIMVDGKAIQHPIALALAAVARHTRVTPYHLNRLIDARDAELSAGRQHLMTLDDLATHGEATASTLNYLMLGAVGSGGEERLAHAASHVGVAQAMVETLRGLAARRGDGLPAEVTARAGVSQDEMQRRGGEAAGVADAVFALASEAKAHLDAGRAALGEGEGEDKGEVVPKEALGVFAGAVAADTYLARLQVAHFDAWAPAVRRRGADWRLAWRLWAFYRSRAF